MRINRVLAVLVAGVAGVTAATAQISKTAGGYTFKQKFTKGQVIKFNTDVNQTMSGQPKPMALKVLVTQKVLSVSGNVAEIEVVSGAPMMNGQPMGQAQTVKMKMDDKGNVVGGQGTGNQSFATFPKKAVKIGETWSSSTKIPGMPGGDASATYKLVAVRRVGGQEVAEVAVSVVSKGSNSLKGSGTTLIRTSDGSMQSSKMKMALNLSNPQNNQQMKIDMSINITRG